MSMLMLIKIFAVAIIVSLVFANGSTADVLSSSQSDAKAPLTALLYVDIPMTMLNSLLLIGGKPSRATGHLGIGFGVATILLAYGMVVTTDRDDEKDLGYVAIGVGAFTALFGFANVQDVNQVRRGESARSVQVGPLLTRDRQGSLAPGVGLAMSF